MKLLINGYNLRGNPVGIANVVINFINSISIYEDFEIDIAVFKDIPKSIAERIILRSNIKITKIGVLNSFLWLFGSFVKYANQSNADILWSPTPILPFFIKREIKKLITVHDFVSKDFRKTMTLKGRMVTIFVEPKTIKNADLIWCDSYYTKKRMEQIYSNLKAKEILLGCAPDPFFKEIDEKDKIKFFLNSINVDKDFILFVGSLEPRKNLKFLLNVYKAFRQEKDLKLVVVGARKWGATDINDIIKSEGYPKNDVIFTNFLSEEDLRMLYNAATCFVSTSLNEGFGLPQAEAMKCGCPVVTAHNSAMAELVEGAGVTVENWNISDWVRSIAVAIDNKKVIIEKQNRRIALYSWNIIAGNIFDAIIKYSTET